MSGPEDYRCRECGELVLFRSDHTPECKHYPPPTVFLNSLS